jgi:hypothetical protein
MASGEYRNMRITALYQQCLGRTPEGNALVYWTNFLLNGGSELNFKAALLASPEYQSLHASDTLFVQSLYTDILGRSADTGGENFWVQALPTSGHAGVVNALLRSPESYRRLINDAYQTFLGRQVDNSSADYWLAQLNSGAITFTDLFAKIADSTEYGNL